MTISALEPFGRVFGALNIQNTVYFHHSDPYLHIRATQRNFHVDRGGHSSGVASSGVIAKPMTISALEPFGRVFGAVNI
jgi:hypothetical protein